MTIKNKQVAQLNGLVLAGGKSSRMGQPKDRMIWSGKEQRYHAADLLKQFCGAVYISCRHDQAFDFDKAYNALPDTFLNIGPMGGILSALRSQRDKAWLVIACDLPLLDHATIEFLVSNRDPEQLATTYESPHDRLPEPLIAIWEPESYPVLLHFLGQDITCPRKVLINSKKKTIRPKYPNALMNVNTPTDVERASALLHSPSQRGYNQW